MYNLIKSNRRQSEAVGFDDELGRVNYVALFETSGHIITGDIQLILESMQGQKFSGTDGEIACEIFDTLYSHPMGFCYVGLSTADPEPMYQYMMTVASSLPGQISFIGIFPYDGIDGSACDNEYIQKLGLSNIQGSRMESNVEWVLNIYQEMHGGSAVSDPDTWRDVINNCMFWLGIPEIGEDIERAVQDVDNALEAGDMVMALDTVLNTELCPYILRVLIYFSLMQDLHEYVTAD